MIYLGESKHRRFVQEKISGTVFDTPEMIERIMWGWRYNYREKYKTERRWVIDKMRSKRYGNEQRRSTYTSKRSI